MFVKTQGSQINHLWLAPPNLYGNLGAAMQFTVLKKHMRIVNLIFCLSLDMMCFMFVSDHGLDLTQKTLVTASVQFRFHKSFTNLT